MKKKHIHTGRDNGMVASHSLPQLRGCLVASYSLPHFILGKFDKVGKCLVEN